MEIIECSPEMSIDRMYCPSTDEVIFAPGYEELNEDANASDPNYNADAEEDMQEMSDEELTNEINSKQIKAVLNMSKRNIE